MYSLIPEDPNGDGNLSDNPANATPGSTTPATGSSKPSTDTGPTNAPATQSIQSFMGDMVNNPSLAPGTEMTAAKITADPRDMMTTDNKLLSANPTITAERAQTTAASDITPKTANTYDASTIGNRTPTMDAAQGEVSSGAQMTAAQGTVSDKSVATAAQGEANRVDPVAQRELQTLNKKLGEAEARSPGTIKNLAQRLGYTGEVANGKFDQWLWDNPNKRAQLDAMFGSEVLSGSAVDQSKVDASLQGMQASQNVMTTTLNTKLGEMEAANPGTMQRLAKQLGFPDADKGAPNPNDPNSGWGKGKFDQWLYDNPDKREQLGAMVGANEEDRTMAGQIKKLTSNFDASNPPPWAAGAIRGVAEQMAARGLSASSIAGQALVQAALESAMPIAQFDANQNFQAAQTNLSLRQQMSLQKAELRAKFMGQEFDQNFQTRVLNAARVSEIANMNFTAEQTVALENARIMQNMNMANLNNRQATALANAATYASMDFKNLDNRQQAAAQNAQAFLQMDMANLSNRQQSAALNHQARIQTLLSDQAAENAAKQFNAQSKQQTDQFYDGLSADISKFNASQTNAMNQFNAGQSNAMEQFTANLRDSREKFNATQATAIEQSNVQWRRQISTANTAAENAAIATNVANRFNLSSTAIANLWQQSRDAAEYAFTESENGKQRAANMAMSVFQSQQQFKFLDQQKEDSFWESIGSTFARVLGKSLTDDD